MKNKVEDLTNHLFAQLERLGYEEISKEQLDIEIQRSKAIVDIGDKIIVSHKNSIEAMKIIAKFGNDPSKMDLGFYRNQIMINNVIF